MTVHRMLLGLGLVVAGVAGVAPAAEAANRPWAQFSAGGAHACGINAAKNLYCWGQNGSGQVGDGTTGNIRPSPTKIGGSGVWAAISPGATHTCGITTAKNLYCWGSNAGGQIGDGTTTPRPSPTKIAASGVWTSIDAGDFHTCGITTAKNLYCWGFNSSGQIGDGTTVTPRPSPIKIAASGVWASVNAGAHTCGITVAKNLYCWGSNLSGQIGDGTIMSPRPSPTKIAASGVWTRITTGGGHTCGITVAKNLYCWGESNSGQIGDGDTATDNPSPTKIAASGVWASVTAGAAHTCGITMAKNLYCWGDNISGQIGDGTAPTDRPSPTKIAASGVWAGVSAGGSHTCGINTAQSLFCWGGNSSGQIGDGTVGGTRPFAPHEL